MRLLKFVACALVLFLAQSLACASSVTADLTSVTNGGVAITPYIGTTAMSGAGIIGQYNWKVVNSPSPLGNPGATYYTFCIEITQDITFNQDYTYTLTTPWDAPNPVPNSTFLAGHMSTQSAAALGRLWSDHINDVLNAPNAGQELFNAAAFQIAVWKLVYDS